MPKPNFPDLQYQGVGGLSPGRAVLDLSHAYSVDALFGKLIPIVAEECVPGDVVKYACDCLARMNPSIVPFMHEVNVSYHCFFVPYRIVWPKVDETGDDWESYIVGATWDAATDEFVENSAVLPVWDYTSTTYYAKRSLYDHFGFQPAVVPAVGSRPHSLWSRAYAMIWNEWYRDQDLTEKVDITAPIASLFDSALEKDYFTSARPFQQKGIAPALPISGIGSAVFDDDVSIFVNNQAPGAFTPLSLGGANPHGVSNVAGTDLLFAPKPATGGFAGLDDNTIDFSEATSINISDLRLSVQIQKYLERNARAGNRYTEWLQAHFGVSPKDSRLQRPEYLGGGKLPVIISEVLQTSQSNLTPQGTLAGHGIAVGRNQVVSGYRVDEFGVFMVMARVLPRTMYTQGVHRRAVRNSPYEFYHTEYAHLSEQAVTRGELFVNGTNDNDVFGFQARYQEYRTRNSIAVAEMRDTLKQWNLGRAFSGTVALSTQFVTVDDTQRTQWMTRAFAVTSQAPFILTFGNRIVMSRPMPGLPEPGLMDHF